MAIQKGCLPAPRWAARWPLGLDLLLKASLHARKETILQFFLEVMDSSGSTQEQHLRTTLDSLEMQRQANMLDSRSTWVYYRRPSKYRSSPVETIQW